MEQIYITINYHFTSKTMFCGNMLNTNCTYDDNDHEQ